MVETACSNFKVVVIGGGLVGSLATVYFANKDIRQDKHASGRSINLALSTRGIEALKGAGVDDEIIPTLIPMKGRYIHALDGSFNTQNYGIFGQCINSVDRKLMNEKLLTVAEKHALVKLNFEVGVERCDFESGEITFVNNKKEKIIVSDADLIIGADGAFSKVRQQLLRQLTMNFSQEYIGHLYVELNMPPTKSGDYAMDSNHLHIWPRETFMMIALPNLDKSFTVTLFMPKEKFASIKTHQDLLTFFDVTFPDAVTLIGRDLLVEDYFKNPKGTLMTVKCDPYHYKNKAVIVGDAAHAMVPFYGQGMNCGFEDLIVLNELFSEHVPSNRAPTEEELGTILSKYTETRKKDAHAICDLAKQNYIEMRSGVINPKYLLRKKFEDFWHRRFPDLIVPLYTMVSFSRIPYSEALQRYEKQTTWFEWYLKARITFKVVLALAVAKAFMPLVKKLIQ
ncbi:kynurenine 3-monooxygenase, mitochondrial precursor [Boothiomyces macroporosus]|uniref:Kynurenine 3-monooxygenase n=1 Tax=Boothiomyces macroporosus TaxID=261099 RepID=A0AAD5Y4S7_9FUNG|nr:kynurenine 3-monooxygenase, mitochondrial precursor [Boothiomyces macroporosus]